MKNIVTGIELTDEQRARLVILHRNVAGLVDNPGTEEINFLQTLPKKSSKG